MAASQNGHVEVVDKLLQHGATVDLQKEVHTLYVHIQCSLLEKPAPIFTRKCPWYIAPLSIVGDD